MWLPDADAVISIHYGLVQLFLDEEDPISPSGVKSQAMLESACSRPHVGIGNIQKYKTLESKLAALFHSLTKNHPFHNGNKRTALVTLLTTLHRNNRRLETSVTDDQLYDFVVAVTADEFPSPNHSLDTDAVVDEIAAWIKKHSVPMTFSVPAMKTKDFLQKCKAAGAQVRLSKKGGSYVISHNGSSIRISKSTHQLSGSVTKIYLQKLHLNESESGIPTDEFQEGASDEKAQIYRFISALRRLAKT